ncbi:MAG: STAS domain-containing protein [Pirellulaceae bacterium]|nr:STAS domain-containing protein [Planctomycetales bacterium]
MAGYQQIKVTEVGDVAVVRFKHRRIIDEAAIQELGDELFALVEQEKREAILLNFEDVEFLSSAALGKLIKMDKKVKSAAGKLKLASIRPEIYEVFTLTRLDRLFDIKDSEREALAAF